jgi:geranylgeranyl pyrophosphate synthase
MGQGQDIMVHKITKAADLPKREEYFRMTSAKTGSLLRMLVLMSGVVLDIDRESMDLLVSCMTNVGISFQITDDVLNVMNRVDKMGKGVVA